TPYLALKDLKKVADHQLFNPPLADFKSELAKMDQVESVTQERRLLWRSIREGEHKDFRAAIEQMRDKNRELTANEVIGIVKSKYRFLNDFDDPNSEKSKQLTPEQRN